MLIAAIATDLTILGSIELSSRAAADGAMTTTTTAGPGSGVPVVAVDAGPALPPWAMCFVPKVAGAPMRAALTYLHPGQDGAVTVAALRGWLGDLDPAAVEIWRLEDKSGERRVGIELPSETWPRWGAVGAGLIGDALCDRLHADLRAHGVGRPRPAAVATAMDQATRSRHDVELLAPRRPALYRELVRMGTVAELTEPRLAALRDWLDAPPAPAPEPQVDAGGVP